MLDIQNLIVGYGKAQVIDQLSFQSTLKTGWHCWEETGLENRQHSKPLWVF